MLDFLESIEFTRLVWIIPVVQPIHELEEWNILKWYKENYVLVIGIPILNLYFKPFHIAGDAADLHDELAMWHPEPFQGGHDQFR